VNYLYSKSIHFLSEISIISLTFLLAFNIPVLAQSSQPSNTIENKYVYQNSHIKNLSVVGVAISTNLGTRHTQMSALPATIYKDVLSIEEVLANAENAGWDDLISKNMILLKEYRNISSTDISVLVSQSYDKQATIKSYLDMLQSQYTLANRQIASLSQQKQIFESTMVQTNNQIEQLKIKISKDFSSVNTQSTLENIEKYRELKDKFNTARTYVVFINKFIVQYEFLNNYNSEIATTIINNSEAIIKDAFIVIPSSWNINLLQDLNLIVEEKQ